MAVDKTFLMRNIQKKEDMIVAFCMFTNMPFVVCDPETFNDQIWIFDTEEQLQEFAKKYSEKKVLLKGIKFQNQRFLSFFSMLFTIGVNELVFVSESGTDTIELAELVKRPDFSQLPKEQQPVSNPELQLTGLYFMQEASRPVPNEQKNLVDLEEELAHCGVDRVADEIRVERLKDGLADENLGSHRGGMGHAGAADRLDQSFFDHAVFDVERQLAGALLRRAPAHTVGETGNVLDFLCLDPFALFGNGRGAMICALGNRTHMLYFSRINHKSLPFRQYFSRQPRNPEAADLTFWIIPKFHRKVKKSAGKSTCVFLRSFGKSVKNPASFRDTPAARPECR